MQILPFVGCHKVLLIEAEPAIRRVLEEGLEDEGLEFCSARTLDIARKLLDAECTPAVVVLDFSFPLDETAELLARLHTEPRLKDVPILVTSTLPEAQQLHADLVLPMPFDLDRFLRSVKTLAERTAREQAAAR